MDEPQIFMPAEAGTATAPDGAKLVFFRVPQLGVMIKQVLAERPTEYTYRWAYHPGHGVHVLLFGWPTGHGAGLAIPEGAGDAILEFMAGKTQVFVTTEPVQERLSGQVAPEEIEKLIVGNTVALPDVQFTANP